MEYRENIESNNLDKFTKNYIINWGKRDKASNELKDKFDIKIPHIQQLVLNLSGWQSAKSKYFKMDICKFKYINC